ncbi:MAG: DNA-directed RNA polymerase subunit D [Candidatus Bathyarchaeota archaeon]|nr:DNA-directed RNA polymerase subunit D [Candidatus Bathyarchaeota archaeon]
MHMQIIGKYENSVRFKVKGISSAFANTLRRIIVSEVPTMAIDEVVIIENSSVLHDEILALRLGLVPLKTDLDSYNLPEECSCKSEFGCNLCRSILTLDVEAKNGVRTVYSGDFFTDNPDIVPISDKIPIVKLASGQKVRLEAYARLGRGKVHVKWQPVSVCAYRYMPIINIDESRCDECDECVEICPKDILVKEDGKIRVQNLEECTLCKDCVKVCKIDPAPIEVNWDDETFIFDIESNGVLPVERIVSEGLKILNKKISDLTESMQVKEDEKGD